MTKLIKVTNIVLEDVHRWDFPDLCDAFIVSCDIDGEPATEEQLEEINENSEFVHEKAMESLY